ncbi:hypothetical protein Bca52824_035727 [Brassica carinata]|uniref:Uncharacterized protein n=1 Tax=Brassica carinata TaxID=52824 RepID=A0A8X7S3C5_BRACI|nr:hypothetical protein Bca52824_035727 [Brassica carinata]
MASVTTLISSSSTRVLPPKSSLPSPSLSFLPTLSSPSPSASLGFARPSSLTSVRSTSRRSFAVKAQTDDLPLVGNKAPDFEAEAVFDQDFIKEACGSCNAYC